MNDAHAVRALDAAGAVGVPMLAGTGLLGTLDEALAAALLAHADAHLSPEEGEGGRNYGGRAAPLTTALFALGEAGGLGQLLNKEPRTDPALVDALLQ